MSVPSMSQSRTHSYLLTSLVAALIALALAMPASAAASSSAGWHAQNARAAGSDGSLAAVSFVDTAYGWALGTSTDASFDTSPTLLATTDGGTHWDAEYVGDLGSDGSLLSIHFADRSDGWAVGGNDSGPIVLATSDGGANWSFQDGGYGGDGWLSAVTFVDAKHGWAVGSGFSDTGNSPLIIATSDGGLNWTVQKTGPVHILDHMAELDAVTFVNDRVGWAVGNTGGAPDEAPIILATSNGGLTWKAERATARRVYGGLYAVSFVGSRHGWAVGGDGGEQVGQPVILSTADGGQVWRRDKLPSAEKSAFLGGVDFASTRLGWAVGCVCRGFANGSPVYRPNILVTRNGGRTWGAQNASSAGSRGNLSSIAVVGTRHCWAVGAVTNASGHEWPRIIATSNGGFPK